jgi:hypothetical protein
VIKLSICRLGEALYRTCDTDGHKYICSKTLLKPRNQTKIKTNNPNKTNSSNNSQRLNQTLVTKDKILTNIKNLDPTKCPMVL